MLTDIFERTGSYPKIKDVEHDLAKQFPLISEDKTQDLAEDIKQNNLYEKIVIYQGRILDGRNRYEALKLNKHQFAEADFRDYDELDDGLDPECYVISRNIKRRQLTPGQLAAWGHEYAERREKAKRGRPPASESAPGVKDAEQYLDVKTTARETAPRAEEKSPSIDGDLLRDRERNTEAAAVTGSSVVSIERFGHLKRVAPEKAAEVKAGTKTLHAATEEVAEKTGKRAPRKLKPATMEFKGGHTLEQVFHEMAERGYKTAEVIVKDRGRAIFTSDADIKPQRGFYLATKSEILAIAAAEDPPISESDALDMLDDCKSKDRTYKDWAAALRNWRRRGWLWSQKPKSSPQRAPQGRSTAKTVEEHNRAAAAQERAMQASLAREASRQGKDGQWKH
jgi:hypothetical protein